ncbi:MAG: hypothetical protein JOS17DRAFT_361169 [Linnemannia elongata]|nr:MAG: hypothetical protein JOS17DRAFT_361169 [Linnemannia elongata]
MPMLSIAVAIALYFCCSTQGPIRFHLSISTPPPPVSRPLPPSPSINTQAFFLLSFLSFFPAILPLLSSLHPSQPCPEPIPSVLTLSPFFRACLSFLVSYSSPHFPTQGLSQNTPTVSFPPNLPSPSKTQVFLHSQSLAPLSEHSHPPFAHPCGPIYDNNRPLDHLQGCSSKNQLDSNNRNDSNKAFLRQDTSSLIQPRTRTQEKQWQWFLTRHQGWIRSPRTESRSARI